MGFTKLGLISALEKAVVAEHFGKPYPIQQQVIPPVLKGGDVLGIAPTGSGKTASYVLPILSGFKRQAFRKNRHVPVLVLVPTRELAIQVNKVFHQFVAYLPSNVRSLAVYGGASINPQMKALMGVDVLVATPGRLLELVDSNALHLSALEILVLDEADKMLNLGFSKEVDRILKMAPKKRQNLLFSATLSPDLEEINKVMLKDPTLVKVEGQALDLSKIEQTAFQVKPEKRGPYLRYLIKTKELRQVLIFTASTLSADKLADKLRQNGIEAKAVHSKKSQHARTSALKELKEGTLRVVVATDLLSRGIDIPELEAVINYELPRSPKDFVHRIGRTGRAEAKGVAYTLIAPEDEHHFKVIQKKMKRQVEYVDASGVDVAGY